MCLRFCHAVVMVIPLLAEICRPVHFLTGVDSAVTTADHRGRHFVTGFLRVDSSLSPELLLVPQVATTVNVSLRSTSSLITPRQLAITAGTTSVITLTNAVRMTSGETTEKKGIEITATDDIAIYTTNRSPHSDDGMLLLPTDALATDYAIPLFIPGQDHVTSVGLISAYNNTAVRVSLQNVSKSAKLRFGNTTYSRGEEIMVNLNELETVQLQCECDLKGLRISSNRSVAVILGGSKDASGSKEFFEEQLTLTNAWGTTFIALSYSTGDAVTDVFTITSLCDNTTVNVETGERSMKQYEFQAGGAVSIGLNDTQGYIIVVTNRPVNVLQYYCQIQAQHCKPFLLTIPPLLQGSEEYIYSTVGATQSEPIEVHLVIKSLDLEGLLINGKSFRAFTNSETGVLIVDGGHIANFTAVKVHLPTGVYNISHLQPGTPFTAISPASPIGMRVENLGNGGDICAKQISGISGAYKGGEEVIVSDPNKDGIDLMQNKPDSPKDSPGASSGLPGNVIAVIVTLTSAVFFVIVCILGFVMMETICRRIGNKISPFQN